MNDEQQACECEHLLDVRNRLMNSFGHGPAADGATLDRIAEIDRQLAKRN